MFSFAKSCPAVYVARQRVCFGLFLSGISTVLEQREKERAACLHWQVADKCFL